MEIKKLKYTKYGLGGYDTTKPNNNIIEETLYDEPAINKIEKVKFLVYLSRIGKYKDVTGKLNTFTEEELIIYNNIEFLTLGTTISNKLKGILLVTDTQFQGIFNRANEINL